MSIGRLFETSKVIAVLGIKTEAQAEQPSFSVPQYLAEAGFQIVPVPVYYPEVTRILNAQVYRTLAQIPIAVDGVCVFRRPQDLMPHVADILAKKPRWVWLQSGIRNDEFAAKLAEAGIEVIQDQCMMVEHRRFIAGRQQ